MICSRAMRETTVQEDNTRGEELRVIMRKRTSDGEGDDVRDDDVSENAVSDDNARGEG